MTQISDTLRMELVPFSVKVITVHTGAVKSNALADGPSFKLPSTSRYLSIEKEISARARGEDGVPRMETSVYADKVVGDVLAGANCSVWRGSVASLVWYFNNWTPRLAVGTAVHSMYQASIMLTIVGLGFAQGHWPRRDEENMIAGLTTLPSPLYTCIIYTSFILEQPNYYLAHKNACMQLFALF